MFLQISLISDSTEDSWILTSSFAFSLLRYVSLIEVFEEICKNIKQCHSPYSVYFGKFNYFSRNVILLTYNGFIIVIFKWNNIQRFSQKIWQMSIDIILNSIINKSSLVYLTIFENVKGPEGLPWWFSGRESAYQCRRCGFQPRVRKIPWRRK